MGVWDAVEALSIGIRWAIGVLFVAFLLAVVARFAWKAAKFLALGCLVMSEQLSTAMRSMLSR